MRVKSIVSKDPGGNDIINYQYNYDKMDNIESKNTEHGNYAYEYDDLYRLTTSSRDLITGTSLDEGFTYDKVGNRLTSADTTGNWTYNANNELQTTPQSIFGPTGGTSFVYDDNGNMTQKTVDSVITNFMYNIEDRLKEVRDDSDNLVAEYYYDPFGRRLWKDVGGTRTYFLYAEEGLVGEYDNSGTEIKTYSYIPDSTWTTDPLFMKEGQNYYFYHNDHLGTPQRMTTVNGAIVWSANYEAFGKVEVSVTSTITNNLRFPGQYEDQETKLYYNCFRYYDPMIGRYLRVDPIGLDGGINLYAYAGINPIGLIDPLGLDWLDTLSNLSAGFGDTISFGITYKIREYLGTNSVLNPCSSEYHIGEVAGIAHSLAMGGLSIAKGALAMGGRSGSILTRFTRGLGRFFKDPRRFPSVSKQYWGSRFGANGKHLHHWFKAQQFGGANAGWNLLELPGSINSWMAYSKVGAIFEKGLRVGIIGLPIAAVVQGANWGMEREEWKNQCKCKK